MLADDSGALPEHAPEWIDAMADSGPYADASRLYEFRDGRRFILPLVRRSGLGNVGGWYGSYPPAWGIGGLVGADLDADVVRAVLSDLYRLRAARIVLRPDPQQAGAWAAGAVARPPGVTVIPRRAHVIDLSGGPEAVRRRMSATALRGIRTAEKSGVTVQRGSGAELIPCYFDLYASSVVRWAKQQNEPLVLARFRAARRDSIEKMYHLARRMGPAFQVFVAFVDGQPAAVSITLLGNTAHDIRAAMNRDVAGKPRANELLQWVTVQEACKAGCSAFHLGESGASATLAKYKEKFGARPFDYAEYRIERVPITRIDTTLRTGVKRLIGFRDVP